MAAKRFILPLCVALISASIDTCPAIVVLRGPYLQRGTSTNILIRWRTDSMTNSRVRYGTSVTNLNSVVDDSASTNQHKVVVNNLSPDTKYFYSVGTISGVLAGGDTNHFFRTAPLPGTVKAVRVWVIGDAGTADSNQQAVRDAYYDFTGSRETDLWLMLGDNAYFDGTDSQYQTAVFDMYASLLRKSVVWPTLGNHDTAGSTDFNGSYPYFSMFTLPINGEAGGVASGTEHYYSFDYANIHFICLDSMTADRATNAAMANWLRADLADTTNTWIIAYWHHPPYSKGSHDSDGGEVPLLEMRQNLLPILEQGGVDLVLTGHSHSYERSFLIDGHYGYSWTLTNSMTLNTNSGRADATGPYIKSPGFISHQGAIYAVVGSSGQTSGGALNHPVMYASLNQLGSMVLDIEGNRLDATFLREDGSTPDYFAMVKQGVGLADSRMLSSGSFQTKLTPVAAGKTNLIQASPALSNWITIGTNVVSSNSFIFTDPDATNHSVRFYRVLRLP